ncbi:MAG TPA: DNA mismatch repair endonuclease MutL [Candidatus Caccousia avistercoris]|nr:DNA mismatch repair endonuclease MutL [Candidatus Caccousia avistercoris]
MARIQVLDKHVAELIAAGEVVERPSSVVKELVENAVDAGSSVVTVEIKHGGASYLRVTDNGCGIAREDVPVAFLRHATSKVRDQEDLEGIGTLGFRGEALASIAAVARVELLTRERDQLAGTRYVISGGEEEALDDAGCAPGTTIIVRDIFYNTPARMKFLKKDVVEGNSVAGVMDKIALSHPEVSFRFLRDGKEVLHTPGDGSLKSAIYAVFGKEFTQGLLPVRYEYGGVSVEGYVSKPAAARPNRSMQNFFLNGRYVKSRTAMVALEEAFKGSLMVGKLPACVLHLKVSFRAVDVNVHPAKIEVRFVNEKPVFDCIYHGVKTALNQEDTPSVASFPVRQAAPVLPQPAVPEQIRLSPPPSAPQAAQAAEEEPLPPRPAPPSREEPEISVPRLPQPYAAGAGRGVLRDSASVFSSPFASRPAQPQPEPEPAPLRAGGETEEEPAAPAAEAEPAARETAPPAVQEEEFRLVGEAFATYIILERGGELVWIDKHAAHERMIYEKLKAQRGDADCQLLLQPVSVTLEKNEYAAVLEAGELFRRAGFEVEDFGAGTILVRTAPMILEGQGVADAVMEMAGYLARSKTDLTTEKLDWLYHNVACRAAVKAGDESSPQEMLALARRLAAHPEIRYCPHGRPVSIVMRKKDLEKQFGRIS